MSKKTVLQEVNSYIEQVKKQNAADLNAADQGFNDAAARANRAEADMKAAIDKMDMTAYETAKAEKEKAESDKKFYAGRQTQLYKRESVPDEKRRAVVDDLMEYERDLAEKFDNAILPHVAALEDLYSEYAEEIQSVENTLAVWTREMCPGDFIKTLPDAARYHLTVHYWKDFLSYAARHTGEYCDKVREGDPAIKTRAAMEASRREHAAFCEQQKQERAKHVLGIRLDQAGAGDAEKKMKVFI